ncbi:MAG: hypothetical protein ACK2UR_03460 [Candidatus Promineifilaceae bacterium]
MFVILKRTFSKITFYILTAGVILAAAAAAHGQEVLNVDLTRFEAIPAEDGIRLEWDVETELGTAGYTIKRAEGNESFQYLLNPNGDGNLFIFAEGGPAQAYIYSYVDDTAVREKTYIYQLIEITTSSREDVQSSFTVTFLITPTPTPVTFSGNTGGSGNNNSSAQATATPTATLQPTSTPISQATATSIPQPTRVAPTPPPSPTAVQANAAPTAAAPSQPSPALEAYPAEGEITSDINSTASDIESVQDDMERQVDVTTEETTPEAAVPTPEQIAMEAPQEAAQGTQPELLSGVANALVIRGDLNAKKAELSEMEPADGSPIVIGSVTATTLLPDQAQQENQEVEPANVDSSRILLWVAFIVALAIFSASVIGAIYLYSRRRPL